jgi:hypothetical protein
MTGHASLDRTGPLDERSKYVQNTFNFLQNITMLSAAQKSL